MLDGVPRRISLGFAHSTAAVGDGRRISVRSVDLKQTVCSDGRKAVARSVDLKQNVCFSCESRDFAAGPAGRSHNTCIYNEKLISFVFRRESEAELASLPQSR